MGMNLRYSPLEYNEVSKNYDFGVGTTLSGFNVNPSGGADYYVDGNTNNPVRDGKAWATAFKTLAAAIAASNTSIALTANRWWARRNRIFVVGDTITEDLLQLPTKCDVIGLGSYDGNPMCGLYGHHSSAAEA